MDLLKKMLIRTGSGLLICFLLLVGLFVAPYFANVVMPWDRTEAIEVALLWGGLADLPDNSYNVSVHMAGSMFTRTFIVEFDSNEAEIKKWIGNSKRLRDVAPLIDENGIMEFEIYPREEGTVGGTVKVHRLKNKVTIEMKWS